MSQPWDSQLKKPGHGFDSHRGLKIFLVSLMSVTRRITYRNIPIISPKKTKQPKTANSNSHSKGLIIGRIFASEIWGGGEGGGGFKFREGLFWGELIIRILRYLFITWLKSTLTILLFINTQLIFVSKAIIVGTRQLQCFGILT